MLAVWTLLYVAVYPWGDLAGGLGFVAAAAIGAWLGARRGGPAVAGWALAGMLAGGASTQALAVALAQLATAVVLGQLRDLRMAAEDAADAAAPAAAEQVLGYARALLHPDHAEAAANGRRPALPGVRALQGGTVLVAVVEIDGQPIELAFERARPFDADERAVLALLLANVAGVGRAIEARAPAPIRARERELLAVG